MARSLLVGDTDYSHQSFENIVVDLKEWLDNLHIVINNIEKNETILNNNNYWQTISSNVHGYINYSFEFFKTCVIEIESILSEFDNEIQNHHITRINSLSKTARKIFRNLGKYWHEDSWIKDYENPNFIIVEQSYRETRNMAGDLIDLGNLSERLKDFIGKKGDKNTKLKVNKTEFNNTENSYDYDVAISFAGPQRKLAEFLAKEIRANGFKPFFDEFYADDLWGKDLVVYFDEVYRKKSRYCVIFISTEYIERMWTIHERQSAQARALEERGQEYILPILVDEIELPGFPPTVGYISLKEKKIEEIAKLLIGKLRKSLIREKILHGATEINHKQTTLLQIKDIHTESILITIKVASTGKTYKIKVPINMRVGIFKHEAIKELNLPKKFDNDWPVNLSLINKTQKNKKLSDTFTFIENGVRNGDVLYFGLVIPNGLLG